MAEHNRVGHWGENLAVEYLVKQGYAIVETNWKLHRYEIDIIAMSGNRIIFIEVKTRTSSVNDPLLAVDRRRMSRMAVAAHNYIIQRQIPHEVQFDIITITGTPDNYKLEHIPDAFLPPLHTVR